VACGLKTSQPGRESDANVTEDSNEGVGKHSDEVGEFHPWRPVETGADVGDQRQHVLSHYFAWQYQMEGSATGHCGGLMGVAVLWVWSGRTTLGRSFVHARRLSRAMFGCVAVTTYQGLTGALNTWSPKLLPAIQKRLHKLMEQVGGDEHGRVGLWVALAVDGSRVSTPRTVSNEKAFAAKNDGKGRKAQSRRKWKNKKQRSKKLSAPVKPQMWLTLIWHMGLKMPWARKTGASTSSERQHVLDILETETFPENTL